MILFQLELSDNKITGGLGHLTCCPNITHLSLSGNKIKDFDVLDPLVRPDEIKMLGTSITAFNKLNIALLYNESLPCHGDGLN